MKTLAERLSELQKEDEKLYWETNKNTKTSQYKHGQINGQIILLKQLIAEGRE